MPVASDKTQDKTLWYQDALLSKRHTGERRYPDDDVMRSGILDSGFRRNDEAMNVVSQLSCRNTIGSKLAAGTVPPAVRR
jgi:hypothetical protein